MDEMVMIIVLAAVIAVGFAAAVLLAAGKKKNDAATHNIVANDGVDVDTKRRGADPGSVFCGMSSSIPTSVLNGRTVGTVSVCLRNIMSGERHELQFRESVGIGRSQDIRNMEHFLVLRGDMRISAYHCRLFAAAQQIYIEDMNSSNHTYVNDKRIEHPHPLKNGDIIRIGDTRFLVNF